MTARRPTTYKASYEQEQHRRQHLERRVEAMQQEIDALKWRLHVERTDGLTDVQRVGLVLGTALSGARW